MDFQEPYLKEQIIAYIGNKRRLLELIHESVISVCGDEKSVDGLKFLDLFSGSGIVSRLAKLMKFEVYANDWEEYSYIINRAYLETDNSDINSLFGSREKFEKLLETINNLPVPDKKDQYIAEYYSPSDYDIDNADFRRERLFYTRDNGLIIDKIRNYIESTYSGNTEKEKRIKDLLIGMLIFQSATHTNTSGVFKAFHKGFGGHNRDALKRILTPIRLKIPPLIDFGYPVHVYMENANTLVRKEELNGMDIVYIDPPYNQHQYGSNYHMLNSIALWDKIPAPLDLDEKGTLKVKAAIRKDWVNTRSEYCYAKSAEEAFTDLIKNISSRFILISYSTDGIIPFENMKKICTQKGRISIVTNEYTKYRGGKQSNGRLNTNIEFILIIDTEKKSDPYSVDKVDSVIKRKKLYLLFKNRFSKEKLMTNSKRAGKDSIYFKAGRKEIELKTKYFFELIPVSDLTELSSSETDELYNLISDSICESRGDEIEEILSRFKSSKKDPEEYIYLIRFLPDILRKLAHKKNRDLFYTNLKKIKSIENNHYELYSLIREKIKKTEILAEKRFSG
jgi:adenine-specific DNA-methyltransferase